MNTLSEIRKFYNEGYLEYFPNLTVDCAIFGYHEGKLQIMLIKNKVFTRWQLPGGYVKLDESLEQAAARITENYTGVGNLYLREFKTFSDPHRIKSMDFDKEKLFELTGVNLEEVKWFTRSVSVGFYAISDYVNAVPQIDFFSDECRWFAIDDLPKLGWDHDDMVKEALHALTIHLYHFPVGKNLLPEKFTLKEIKEFYEVMSGKTLHATNFTSRLISLGLLEKLEEKKSIGKHRAPTFYKFNSKVYEKSLKEGLVLV